MAKSSSTATLEAVTTETTDASRDTETPEQAEARRKAELDKAVVELTWTGTGKKPITVTIPKRRGKWSTEAAEAFEDDKFLKALRELMGLEDWEKIKAICPDVDHLDGFADYAGDMISTHCVA